MNIQQQSNKEDGMIPRESAKREIEAIANPSPHSQNGKYSRKETRDWNMSGSAVNNIYKVIIKIAPFSI